jgi:hypothetical protein
MMVAALWANGNMEKKDLDDSVRGLEDAFEEAVLTIHADRHDEPEEEDSPLIKAAKRGVAKLEQPQAPDGTVREAIDYTEGIDQ